MSKKDVKLFRRDPVLRLDEYTHSTYECTSTPNTSLSCNDIILSLANQKRLALTPNRRRQSHSLLSIRSDNFCLSLTEHSFLFAHSLEHELFGKCSFSVAQPFYDGPTKSPFSLWAEMAENWHLAGHQMAVPTNVE